MSAALAIVAVKALKVAATAKHPRILKLENWEGARSRSRDPWLLDDRSVYWEVNESPNFPLLGQRAKNWLTAHAPQMQLKSMRLDLE
jgi:hypothetical protein